GEKWKEIPLDPHRHSLLAPKNNNCREAHLTPRDVELINTLARNLNFKSDILTSPSMRYEVIFTPESALSATIDEWCDWIKDIFPELGQEGTGIRRKGRPVIVTLAKKPERVPSRLVWKNTTI